MYGDDDNIELDEAQEINQEDAWGVIQAFFGEKGLVRQQLDSFDEFIMNTMQEIVDEVRTAQRRERAGGASRKGGEGGGGWGDWTRGAASDKSQAIAPLPLSRRLPTTPRRRGEASAPCTCRCRAGPNASARCAV